MKELRDLVLASLPEALGGLMVIVILAVLGWLSRVFMRRRESQSLPPESEQSSSSESQFKVTYLQVSGVPTFDQVINKVKELVTSSRYPQAIRVAEQARQAATSMGQLLELDPQLQLSFGELNVWYAHALMYTGATDDALSLLFNEVISPLKPLKSVYEDDQMGSRRWSLVLGRAHNHIGYAHWMERGHYEAALIELHRAIDYFRLGRHDEELATSYDNLGRIYCQIGLRTRGQLLIRHGTLLRRELASRSGDDYRYALSLNSSAIAHLLAGQAYMALLESEEACRIFEQRIREKGERGYGLALITKGRTLRYMGANWRYGTGQATSFGHIQEAIRALEVAEKIFSERVDEDIRLLEAYCELGRAHRELAALWLRKGDNESMFREAQHASRYLTQVIEPPRTKSKYPVLFADACHDLGQVYFIIGDHAKAKHYLERALDAIPADYQMRESVGLQVLSIEECIEEYWQILAKIYRLMGEMIVNDQLNSPTLSNETIECFTLAAGYFGRFLERPLSPGNAWVYPSARDMSEVQLESHRLFVQQLHTMLMLLPEPSIAIIRNLVYDMIGGKYRISHSWLDRFFAEPFSLLLHNQS